MRLMGCCPLPPWLAANMSLCLTPRTLKLLAHALCELYAFHHAHMRAKNMHPQRLILQLAILGALIKGYLISLCRVNPALCSQLNHEYKVVVNVQLATDSTNSTNGTHGVHVEEGTMFSFLDVVSSCDTIILVVCLQMYLCMHYAH